MWSETQAIPEKFEATVRYYICIGMIISLVEGHQCIKDCGYTSIMFKLLQKDFRVLRGSVTGQNCSQISIILKVQGPDLAAKLSNCVRLQLYSIPSLLIV
jgi:hypothetical protein